MILKNKVVGQNEVIINDKKNLNRKNVQIVHTRSLTQCVQKINVHFSFSNFI